MKSSIFTAAIAVVAALSACVVPLRVCGEPEPTSVPYEWGDEDGYYTIESFDQLERFVIMLQDYSFPDSTFTLIADIDCEGRALTACTPDPGAAPCPRDTASSSSCRRRPGST